MDNNQDYILFIRGCYLSDHEAAVDIYNNSTVTIIDETIYDKIPTTFISQDTWIKSTNLLCWHCSTGVIGSPLFIPTEFYTAKHKDAPETIGVHGNFCSWECCARHIDTYDKHLRYEKHRMLKELYTIITGKSISIIPRAKPKEDMIIFGGKLTEYQYKKDNI